MRKKAWRQLQKHCRQLRGLHMKPVLWIRPQRRNCTSYRDRVRLEFETLKFGREIIERAGVRCEMVLRCCSVWSVWSHKLWTWLWGIRRKIFPRTFVRWIQHGVFQPRFSIHSCNDDNSVTFLDVRHARSLSQELFEMYGVCVTPVYRWIYEKLPLEHRHCGPQFEERVTPSSAVAVRYV